MCKLCPYQALAEAFIFLVPFFSVGACTKVHAVKNLKAARARVRLRLKYKKKLRVQFAVVLVRVRVR